MQLISQAAQHELYNYADREEIDLDGKTFKSNQAWLADKHDDWLETMQETCNYLDKRYGKHWHSAYPTHGEWIMTFLKVTPNAIVSLASVRGAESGGPEAKQLFPGQEYGEALEGIDTTAVEIGKAQYRLRGLLFHSKTMRTIVATATKSDQTGPCDKYIVKIVRVARGVETDMFDHEEAMFRHLGYDASTTKKQRGEDDVFYIAIPDLGRRIETEVDICMAIELAAAVDYLHRTGIFHGDVKKDNAVMSKDGRVHLIDLGLAVPISGEIYGTEAYEGVIKEGCSPHIAPECHGDDTVKPTINKWSDVYSLGDLFMKSTHEHVWVLGYYMLRPSFLDRPHIDLVQISLLAVRYEKDSQLEKELQRLDLPVKTAAGARVVCKSIALSTFRQASNILSQLGSDLYTETNLLILADSQEYRDMLIENRKRLEKDAGDLQEGLRLIARVLFSVDDDTKRACAAWEAYRKKQDELRLIALTENTFAEEASANKKWQAGKARSISDSNIYTDRLLAAEMAEYRRSLNSGSFRLPCSK